LDAQRTLDLFESVHVQLILFCVKAFSLWWIVSAVSQRAEDTQGPLPASFDGWLIIGQFNSRDPGFANHGFKGTSDDLRGPLNTGLDNDPIGGALKLA